MTPEEIQKMFDELTAEIAALHSALEAQQAQSAFFRIINENMTDIVTLTDKEGQILFAGKSIERLGYDPASVTGKNVMDYVHPEDLPKVMDAYGDHTGSGVPGRVECRCLCEDGTYLWLETRGTFFKEENSNEPKHLLISRDITERKQAEKNLKESVARFQAIIAHSPLLISVFDTDGRYLLVNPSIGRFLRVPPTQLIGKSFSEVLSPEASNMFMKRIADVKKARGPISVEDSLNSDDGMRHFITTLFPLDDETGEIRSVGAIAHDITNRKKIEKALRESEEKHRCLFETMSQGVVYQKADGEITSANPAAERILGLSFGQMRGMTSMDPRWKMIKEDGSEIPGTEHPAMIALRTGQEIGPVIRGVFHPGKKDYIWLSVTAIPLFHPGEKKPFQVYATFEDISLRKWTEKALQESEKRLNLAMMIKNEGIWDWNLASNETVFDERYYTMAGYAPDEFPQNFNAWAERVHPDDLPGVEAAIKNCLSGHTERLNIEFRFQHRDGSWIWVRGQGQIVERDENGTPLRMIGTHNDITKRKEAENKLRMAHEKLLTILDGIDSTVYVADMDTYEILFMNQHMIDEFGGDKTGDLCFRVFRNNSEVCSCCTNDQLIDRNGCPAGVYTWHEQNPVTGKYYNIHDRAIEWIDGRLVRLQIATDITDLKKMETQLLQAQKMESVGRLAGGVAHDFNNMLTIINGYAEMMADLLPPSDPMYNSVKAILDAGKRSAVVVRKLLAFARKQAITPVPMNLNDVVSSMCKMLQRLIGESIDLFWKPGSNIWLVKMDYGQVDHILVNLVINARDAIANVGKITIETQNIEFSDAYCAVHRDFTPGQYVMLAVSDNGCGMDQHVQDHLFEPFFTTKEIGKGTGLGLPTVYGIIKQNAGFINVFSEVGKGTSVKMYIPRHEV